MKLFEEMIALNTVQFERCLTPPNATGNPSLVVFCDASRQAFGACAYTKWNLNEGKFGVRFVAAKSRVAPLKELSIPHLELQAAVIASRLGNTIQEESRFTFERVRYFLTAVLLLHGSKVKVEVTSPLSPVESVRFNAIRSPQIGRTVPHS